MIELTCMQFTSELPPSAVALTSMYFPAFVMTVSYVVVLPFVTASFFETFPPATAFSMADFARPGVSLRAVSHS
jgi:hypothetical protein